MRAKLRKTILAALALADDLLEEAVNESGRDGLETPRLTNIRHHLDRCVRDVSEHDKRMADRLRELEAWKAKHNGR